MCFICMSDRKYPSIASNCGHVFCWKCYKGFTFVAWYRGGMDDRHVMLSRSKIGIDNTWEHIEFQHQHVGFQHDPTIGDSHNVVVIGISPITGSVHLLYDMHAYDKNKYPDDHFNYSYSIDGAATVKDIEWNIDLFYPKQNYLKLGYNYPIMTYPGFMTTSSGLLIARFRYGGPYNANMVLNVYNGKDWSAPIFWNKSQSYGIYDGTMGGFSIKNDKMHMCFARRTKLDRSYGYLNRGLYYSYSQSEYGFQEKWQSLQGVEKILPITTIDEFLIDDPAEPGDWYKSPSFEVTDDGSIHFIVPMIRASMPINFHYYKTNEEESTFQRYLLDENIDTMRVHGRLVSVNNKVFLISLYLGRLRILCTPAGSNNFQDVYYNPQGSLYANVNTKLWIEDNDDDQLSYHLIIVAMAMNDIRSDQQPIEVLHFLLKDS